MLYAKEGGPTSPPHPQRWPRGHILEGLDGIASGGRLVSPPYRLAVSMTTRFLLACVCLVIHVDSPMRRLFDTVLLPFLPTLFSIRCF